MKLNDIPKLMPVPFGVNGPREELLETSPAGNRSASYADGFPPITMLLKQAGGLPPKGENMNQILFELANGQRWSNSGAGYKFNKAFSEAVGGYPKGAQLLSNDGTKVYVSTKDDNKTDFNTSPGPDWVTLGDYIGLGKYATKTDLDEKLDQNAVVQTTGTSTANVMSQKAVTDLANTKADLTSDSEQSFNGVVSTKKEIAVRTGNRRTLVQAGGLITFSIDNVTWYVATFQNKTGTVAYTSDLSILADKDAKEDQVFNSKISAKEFNAADGNNRNILKASGMITHSSDLSTWYDFILPKRTGTAALTLDAIGSGAHIWYDMTAQRKLDVVYNNTAGKPIEVSIYCKSVHVYINSIRVAAAPVGNRCNISLIVPAGGSISVTSQENSGELVWWSELR